MKRVDRPSLDDARYLGALLLTLVAVALLLASAWLPILGQTPGPSMQLLATLTAVTALAAGLGAVVARRGSRAAFAGLWASFGAAAALGTIGVFSIGFVFLAAAFLLVAAIAAMPNRSGLASRLDWSFVAAFAAGYAVPFAAFVRAV